MSILTKDNILEVDLKLFNGSLENTSNEELQILWNQKLAENINYLEVIIEFVNYALVIPASTVGTSLTALNESLQMYHRSADMDTKFFM